MYGAERKRQEATRKLLTKNVYDSAFHVAVGAISCADWIPHYAKLILDTARGHCALFAAAALQGRSATRSQ